MINFQYFVRPNYSGEKTVCFISWKVHDIRIAWPDTAWLLRGMNYIVHSLKKSGRARPLTSLGNEPKSSFPKEVTRPNMALVLQGMNYAVHSLKKSGHVRPCHEFIVRDWTTQFFPWKSQIWGNIGNYSDHANRAVLVSLTLLVFSTIFNSDLQKTHLMACRYGLAQV